MKKLILFFVLLPALVRGQIITTIAGNGTYTSTGDGGPAISATFSSPVAVTTDRAGNIYVVDFNVIRKIDGAGMITTIAGNGNQGFSGDGEPATNAELYTPQGIVIDKAGNLYIADLSNSRIREVNTSGIITTIAGNGTLGYTGDGGLATNAQLNLPRGLAFDASRNLYIADAGNNVIRKINAAGIITTIAGNGLGAGMGGLGGGFSGDNGPATAAELSQPIAVAVDSLQNLYISDAQNFRIRKVSTLGIITTIAGTGVAGYSGDGGPATTAEVKNIYSLAIDRNNNVYMSDYLSNVIREVNSSGIITTYSGTGNPGFSGDGGHATSAELYGPEGIAIDSTGSLYIADYTNARIRKVTKQPTFINIVNNGMLKIYPNPATDRLNITYDHKLKNVSITNVLGESVYTNEYNAAAIEIDISALAKGIYFIKLNNSVVKKFVKE